MIDVVYVSTSVIAPMYPADALPQFSWSFCGGSSASRGGPSAEKPASHNEFTSIMCGRYSYSARALAQLARAFNVPPIDLEPQYNVAPTTCNPVMLQRGAEKPRFELLRWGLIPSGATSAASAAKLINARSESVAEKPSFRDAYRYRRCLVVSDGFYEWEMRAKPKQPWLFTLADPDAPMVFAGIWESWHAPDQATPILSYAILTTTANPSVARVHHRMPLILDETAWEGWLDPLAPLEGLHALLRPWPGDLKTTAVSPRMNNVRFQGPECRQPNRQPELSQSELPLSQELNSE